MLWAGEFEKVTCWRIFRSINAGKMKTDSKSLPSQLTGDIFF